MGVLPFIIAFASIGVGSPMNLAPSFALQDGPPPNVKDPLAPVAGSNFFFKGGDINILVRDLSTALKQPVIAVSGETHVLRSFTCSLADRNVYFPFLAKNTPYAPLAGTDMILTDGTLPQRLFTSLTDNPTQQGHVATTWPTDAIQKGKITLDTSKTGGIPLFLLENAISGKQGTISWLLKPLIISAHVTNLPIEQFMIFVKRAAGANYESDDGTFSFSIDPDPTYASLQKTLGEIQSADKDPQPDTKLRHELFYSIFNALDEETALSIFDEPGAEKTFNVEANSAVSEVALNYMKGLEEQGQAEGPGGDSRVRIALNNIDRRVPVHIHLFSNGNAVLSIPSFVPGKRISQYNDF